MFTGIVEELGTVAAVEDQGDAVRLTIARTTVTRRRRARRLDRGQRLLPDRRARVDGDAFTADVMRETLDRPRSAPSPPGDRVNLERAVTPTTRLGGHIVQGHVDGTGAVRAYPAEHWEVVEVVAARRPARATSSTKGSITVDGISLTVVDVARRRVHRLPDPETLARTTLGFRQPGDRVNLEVDVIAKYVERLLQHRPPDREDLP